jgi:hypothetical protein
MNFPSISIPFVEGDSDGSLTYAIVEMISISGRAKVKQSRANYRLQVKIVGSNTQAIGYRRDKQKISGKSQKNLVRSEERTTRIIEMTLYEGNGDKILQGPVRLSADSDYDCLDGDSMQDLAFINPLGIQQTVLPFSLGQLESKEAAKEAATRPLNIKIAKKVANVLFDIWSDDLILN